MNNNIDEIIKILQSQHPKLMDANQLEDTIINTLPDRQLPVLKDKNIPLFGPPAWLIAFRTISSVVALALILLCLWQNANVFNNRQLPLNNKQCIVKYKSDFSLLRNSKNYREAYNEYAKEKNSRKSIKNHLKSVYYEKN